MIKLVIESVRLIATGSCFHIILVNIYLSIGTSDRERQQVPLQQLDHSQAEQ